MIIIAYIILAIIFIAPLVYEAHIVYLMRKQVVLDDQLKWARHLAQTNRVWCPACHRKVSPIAFLCSYCSNKNILIPEEGAIFSKPCVSCRKELPTVRQCGQDKLVAFCPTSGCNYRIGKYAGKFPEVIIPIVGDMSTGKSAFITAWSFCAEKNLKSDYGVTVSYPFDGGQYTQKCIKLFEDGEIPEKTNDFNPHGIGMDILSEPDKGGIRLHFYDAAGEVFDPLREESENTLVPLKYYDCMDGVIFIIDPFSTPTLRHKYPQTLLETYGFQASNNESELSCDKFIRGLYDEHDLARDEYHYAPCAVVITKADAIIKKGEPDELNLDTLVGNEAVRAKKKQNSSMSDEDALHEACSSQLHEWGMGRVLTLLEEHFKEVRCFSVSAFGHLPQRGVPFVPQRIELPVLWLLRMQKHKQKQKRTSGVPKWDTTHKILRPR